MRSVFLQEILAVDHSERASPGDHGGGPCAAWFSDRLRRWTMLRVVLPEILSVGHAKRGSPEILAADHAKRGSPTDPGGGPC